MAEEQPALKRARMQPTIESDVDEDENLNKGPSDQNEQAERDNAGVDMEGDLSNAAAELTDLPIRDERRHGIYGAAALGVSPPSIPYGGHQPVNAFSEQSAESQALPNLLPGLGDPSQFNLRPTANAFVPRFDAHSEQPPRIHPTTGGLRLPGTRLKKKAQRSVGLEQDRDNQEDLLPPRYPSHPPVATARQVRTSTAQSKPRTPLIEENIYTLAGDLKKAMANTNHKRKRGIEILPPPAFIYKRTNDPNFNIFDGFLLFPELCFNLAQEMPTRDLIGLYAISKDFHTIIDSRFTTVCINQAMAKAPESAKTFFYRTYNQLCRKDPIARIPHPDPVQAALDTPRWVPSFRWVQMVIYREKVVQEILAVFAENGCPLPRRCGLAIKRMWFLMDMPTNALRIGAIHNPKLITEYDLYFAMAFFVKLDMICNDPMAAEKRDGTRKLMLSMPDGMAMVHRVLTRQRWRKRSDMIIDWVRHTLDIPNIVNNPAGLTPEQLGVPRIFNVEARHVGLLKYEYWGKRGTVRGHDASGNEVRYQYLLRPDQLVMREAVRRGLRFHKHILRCVLYGYVNPETLEDYPPRELPRRIPEYNDEEYGVDDVVGGLRALSVEEGGDPLLDLGDSNFGTRYTHIPEGPNAVAGEIKAAHDSFLDLIIKWQEIEIKEQESDDLPRLDRLRGR